MSAPGLPHYLFGWLGREVAVRLVFSDESGNGSKDDPNTVVAAILVNFDWWTELQEQLEGLIEAQGIDPATYEIKGTRLARDIRVARLHPSTEHERRAVAAKAIWNGAMGLLYLHKVPVFGAAVNRAGFAELCKFPPQEPFIDREAVTPYMTAFADCLTQVDRYVHTLLPHDEILWISDKAGDHENRLKNVLKGIRTIERKFDLRQFDPRLPEPHILHIKDTIYFGHSHESRGLQLADLCAATIAYHLRGETDIEDFHTLLTIQLVNRIKATYVELDPQGLLDALLEDLDKLPEEKRNELLASLLDHLRKQDN